MNDLSYPIASSTRRLARPQLASIVHGVWATKDTDSAEGAVLVKLVTDEAAAYQFAERCRTYHATMPKAPEAADAAAQQGWKVRYAAWAAAHPAGPVGASMVCFEVSMMLLEHASSAIPVPMPEFLHPSTANLVARFAHAMAEKLYAAQLKYGHSDGWADARWEEECRKALQHHVGKGDPRDVAAYCAFMWHHGWPTSKAEQPRECSKNHQQG